MLEEHLPSGPSRLTHAVARGKNRRVHATESEGHLRAMLAQAGVDLEQPDPLETWRVFAKFGATEIDGIEPDDDGLLFWWGGYTAGDPFQLGFLRQFSFYTAAGEYDHMEQLQCAFQFGQTTDLRTLEKGDSWWFRPETRRTLNDWIAEMESLPAFNVLRNGLRPAASVIEQGRV